MPKIWESTSVIIEAGPSVNLDWGPDFGDPSDGTSFECRVGAPVIDTLAIDTTIIVLCELILAASIAGTFDITAECQARIENLLFTYTGPWTAIGTLSGELAPDYNLLTAAGLVERDISTVYNILIAQGLVAVDDIDINYTGPWTALGTVSGDLATVFDSALSVIGTIDGILAPTYALLTSQSSIVVDTLALDHTKTCNCSIWSATANGAVGIEFTGPHTCQGLVDELAFELDFVGAATGVNIDVTVPTGATSMFSEVWSGGGGGGTANVNGGGGGGGGGFASDTEPVVAGTTITVQVGAGGAVGAAGGISIVSEAGTTRCRASGGGAGGNGAVGGQGSAGTAGDATNGDTLRDGGAGGGGGGVQTNGGGGGGGSGTANAGTAGAANRTAGTGGANLGGNGGIGGGLNVDSAAGSQRGGGGGGASATNLASAGARGGVRIRFDILTP